MEFCTNNVSRSGYGDGYIVEGGIIGRDKISIANFESVYDLYSMYQKINEKVQNSSLEI